jgi:hypothetical protein
MAKWNTLLVAIDELDSSLRAVQYVGQVADSLKDVSILSKDWVFNLKKLFPNLPKIFNDLLLHFSVGTSVMYDTAQEFHTDLQKAIDWTYR